MNKLKKTLMFGMALCAVSAMSGGVGAAMFGKADEATSENPTIVSPMIKGASVRMADPTGIRFETEVEKQEGYTYGTLIIPKELISIELLTVNTEKALNAPAQKWRADTSGYNIVLGGSQGENGITNFPELNYNTTLVARSYMEKDGVYSYSDQIERTFAYVASAALADTSEDGAITDTQHRTFLQGVCDYVLGEDGFEFSKTEVVVADKIDLNTLFSSDNGAEGMVAQWSSDSISVATVNEKGEVEIKEEGSATITAKIGTKEANILVKAGTKFEGGITDAADGNAMAELYDSDGKFVAKYTANIKNGAYSIIVESEIGKKAAKAIIAQGEKAAFIDDLTVSKNGAMIEAKYRIGKAEVNGVSFGISADYSVVKNATTAGTFIPERYKNILLANSVTSGDYSYRVSVNTRTSGPKNTGGAVAGITNGKNTIKFIFYAPRNLKIELYNGADMVYSFGLYDIGYGGSIGFISDGSGSNYSYMFEKRDNAIYVWIGKADGQMVDLFKITENGIEISFSQESYPVEITDAYKTDLSNKLATAANNAGAEKIKNCLSGFFGSGVENGVYMVSAVNNTPFTVEKK